MRVVTFFFCATLSEAFITTSLRTVLFKVDQRHCSSITWKWSKHSSFSRRAQISSCAQVSDDLNNAQLGSLEERLWQASSEGDIDQIKFFLDKGANVNAQQPYPEDGYLPDDLHRTTHPGYTAIHLAAMMNHAEAIKILAAAGGDVNARTEALTTPIHVAAVHGRINAVSILAELGADIKAKNEFGADALRMAKLSAGRHKDTIALLEHLTGESHEPWTDTAITGC